MEAGVEIIEILIVAAEGGQAMAGEGALQVVTGLVLGGTPGNGDVVVIDHQRHIQAMGHGKAGHVVHKRPEVTQTAGTELHAGGEAEVRMPGQP